MPLASAAAVACALLLVVSAPARACTICIAPPERTVVDHVLAAAAVVLAREDPSRPFVFAPVEILAGTVDGSPIPLLVDSATRRRLANAPGSAVLLTRGSAAGAWRRHVLVDEAVRPVLDAVLAGGAAWMRPEGAEARFAAFAALHDHPDRTVREIALAELARTPWRLLRTFEPRLPRADLRAAAGRLSELAWVPIRLRLLALAPTAEDAAFLRARLEEAATARATLHLEPLALALVAVDGANGIARLRALYGPEATRTREERSAVARALAIHGTDGEAALREAIVSALGALLSADAALAPDLAVALASMRDWSAADRLAALSEAEPFADPADAFAVAAYVAIAREATRPGAEPRRLRHPFDLSRRAQRP